MSTESGIPDFRSQDGLYRQQWQYPPESWCPRIADPEGCILGLQVKKQITLAGQARTEPGRAKQ